jgi:hypothetical protein
MIYISSYIFCVFPLNEKRVPARSRKIYLLCHITNFYWLCFYGNDSVHRFHFMFLEGSRCKILHHLWRGPGSAFGAEVSVQLPFPGYICSLQSTACSLGQLHNHTPLQVPKAQRGRNERTSHARRKELEAPRVHAVPCACQQLAAALPPGAICRAVQQVWPAADVAYSDDDARLRGLQGIRMCRLPAP